MYAFAGNLYRRLALVRFNEGEGGWWRGGLVDRVLVEEHEQVI